MENTISAIEIGSKQIKLVIGYELNGKVYSIYTLCKPIGQLVQDNGFFDYSKLQETVNSIKEYNDPKGNISFKISDCVLCLPPQGLDILQAKQMTAVASEQGKISSLDMKNLNGLIRNSINSPDSVIVDIIPDEYMLDGAHVIEGNPLGESCHNLTVKAKVHLLPKHIHNNYVSIVEKANLNIKRTAVSSFASVEYLATLDDMPNSYIMVDIGSETTTVSLVGNKKLYKTSSFAWGGNSITHAIAEKFKISFEDAEKYKKIYGIDEREMHFRAPICTDNTGEESVHYYREDLNEIITHSLNEFITYFTNALNVVLEGQQAAVRKLPIVLIGGGSQLKGLVKYMSDKVESSMIKVAYPTTIGARDATFLNCLGAIMVASKYASINDDNKMRTSGMTRD